MRPQNEAELAQILVEAQSPVEIIGGGTRAIGDVVAGATPLYTDGFAGIELYEPGALTLVAGAGSLLSDINDRLAVEKQRLPFEAPDYAAVLGREGRSTLGGVVACNAAGPRRVQAGACRDSMIGVRFVDGAGTIVKNGGRVMKNVTGLDLVKLMAGSHGTLGVLTQVAFKLLPVPEASRTLFFDGQDPATAVSLMAAALGSPYEVTAASFRPQSGTVLRLEGFDAAVKYRASALAKHLKFYGQAQISENSLSVWADIRDLKPFVGQTGDLWRVSVKPSDAAGILAKAAPLDYMLDWGGGLLWLLLPENTDLRLLLGTFEGHATLFRGKGGGAPSFQPQSPAIITLTQGLRAKFDPKAILNKGRMG